LDVYSSLLADGRTRYRKEAARKTDYLLAANHYRNMNCRAFFGCLILKTALAINRKERKERIERDL
jgi:hypothetical protein